jgi:hypothetical protein
MKTLTKLMLTTVVALTLAAPASANSLSELSSELLSKQLSELRGSVKVQAKQALESSVRQVAEQIGLAAAVTPEQTDVATTSEVAMPEAQAKAE